MSKILDFTLKGQELLWDNPCRIEKGTSNFFGLKVKPDEMWNGMSLIAVFSCEEDPENAVRLDGSNSCMIPDEAVNSDNFSVYIYGYNDGSVNVHVTSRPFKIKVR